MNLRYPPSIHLANLPTPIEKLEKISALWEGPEIYIKRDDLTGSSLSGNKVRKLEFAVADALKQNADTLITCGGIQSNHARATAVTASRMGMSSFLILRRDRNAKNGGNLFIDELVGADFKFITPEEYKRVDDIMADVAEMLRKKGKKPYIIPEGASNEIGYFGYIRAAEEISKQLKKMKLDIDFIITATGSGGTLGGLILGKKFFDLKTQPIGVNVCDTAIAFQNRIHNVFVKITSTYKWNIKIQKDEISLIDGYVGKGYALSRSEELKFITEVARLEGIVLDPVYTGKAMFGLRDQIYKKHFKKGQKILFIHTGGIFGLFPKRKEFTEVWRKMRGSNNF